MSVDVVVGLYGGDEGKGKITDILAANYSHGVRYSGGPNAGHTLLLEDYTELNLHQVPSTVAHPEIINVIGDAVLLDAEKLDTEIGYLASHGFLLDPDRLKVSSSAHLILPHHVFADILRETGPDKRGSTKSGISPCAADKDNKTGLRVESIENHYNRLAFWIYGNLAKITDAEWDRINKWRDEQKPSLPPITSIIDEADRYLEAAKRISQYSTDTSLYLNNELRSGKARVLAEGAQGFVLDKDQGTYPWVSATNNVSGAASVGLGIPPHYIDHVYGVMKATQSRVGTGPMPTRIDDEELASLLRGEFGTVDGEFGKTTDRPRDMAFPDLAVLRRAIMVNGIEGKISVALTKLDRVRLFGDRALIGVRHVRKGKPISVAANAGYKQDQSTAEFEVVDTWQDDISRARSFEDLPDAAQQYVSFIERQLETPISIIGVGPGRDQTIFKPAKS